MAIEIPHEEWKAAREHLRRAYPEEGCGLLLGSDRTAVRRVASVVPLPNRHAEARRRYVIEPEAFLSAEKRARDLGLEVLGFFHSHPDGDPRPSPTDLAEAWPYYTYVIAAVGPEGVGEARAYRLDSEARRFIPEPLETVA